MPGFKAEVYDNSHMVFKPATSVPVPQSKNKHRAHFEVEYGRPWAAHGGAVLIPCRVDTMVPETSNTNNSWLTDVI